MAAIVALDQIRRIELRRLTEDNGFGFPEGELDDWALFTGLAIPHTLHVARTADENWLVGMDHAGVMGAVTGGHPVEAVSRPDGGIAVAVAELGPVIRRMARLALSLPPAPLETFHEKTGNLPRATEAECLVIQRVGQDVFRAAVMDFWNSRCPLTGISHPRLLRASHMKPWADCDMDAERLDVHNGLLLAAHMDAAFDAGLITFSDDGGLIASPNLSAKDSEALRLDICAPLHGLTENHLPYLAFHRQEVFER